MTLSNHQTRSTLQVSLLQYAAGPTVAVNLAHLDAWLDRAPAADLLVLPETAVARGSDDDLRAAAEPLTGPIVQHFADQARRRSVWILAGSLLERDGEAIYNTAVLLDRRGTVAAAYRKIHLFDACLPDRRVIRESHLYQAGALPVMANIEGWPCGLSICYDLRFPELYRHYADHGAQLLAIPANFTLQTGRDHWEILIRARAIENQCFVLAPNQCGVNSATGVAAYGHSLMVDPWGTVLACARDAEEWISATLCHEALTAARHRLPALDHRRLTPSGVLRPSGRKKHG